MRKYRWFSAGALLLCLSAAGVGCGADDDDSSGAGSQSGDLKHSGKQDKGDKGDTSEVPEPEDAAAPVSEDSVVDACAAVRCGYGLRCEVQEVQCVRAPCPPIASCVPATPEPQDAGLDVPSCAAVLCMVGTTCIEGPKGAQCVPQDSCSGTHCEAGTHCELQEVQCIQAPCPPQPSCVDDLSACAAVLCQAGTHCVAKQVQCIKAPCDPIVACVPN